MHERYRLLPCVWSFSRVLGRKKLKTIALRAAIVGQVQNAETPGPAGGSTVRTGRYINNSSAIPVPVLHLRWSGKLISWKPDINSRQQYSRACPQAYHAITQKQSCEP